LSKGVSLKGILRQAQHYGSKLNGLTQSQHQPVC
jgi:hypothetical protein